MKNNIVNKMLKVTPVTIDKCLPWRSSVGMVHGNYPQGYCKMHYIFFNSCKAIVQAPGGQLSPLPPKAQPTKSTLQLAM